MELDQSPPNVIYQSPVGLVAVYDNGVAVTGVTLRYGGDLSAQPSELSEQICRQLDEYFSGKRTHFSLPLAPKGTDFQLRLWQQLCRIPFGQVCRYGDLAALLTSSARAVGGACRRNPIPLIVPCHRVVAANGLGGFSGHQQGEWLSVKERLLEHERTAEGNRVAS